LIAAGALSRVGKTLLVVGKGYGRFLAKRAACVDSFQSNNPRMRTDGDSFAEPPLSVA